MERYGISGDYSARRHLHLGTPAQSLRNFAAKQGWNSDSLLFQNAPSHFDSHGKVAEPGDSATWDDSNLWIA